MLKLIFLLVRRMQLAGFQLLSFVLSGEHSTGASRRQPWQRSCSGSLPQGRLGFSLCTQSTSIAESQRQTKLTVSRVMRKMIKAAWPGDWEPGVPGPSFVCLWGCARLLAALWDFSPFLLGGQSWVMLQRLQIIMRAFPKCKSVYSCLGFLYGLLITKRSGFFVSMHFLNCLISSPLYYMLQGKKEILKNCDRFQNEGTGSLLAL